MLSNLSSQCKMSSVVLDERTPHVRIIPDGTIINLDVNSVHNGSVDCLDETGPVFSWQGQ